MPEMGSLAPFRRCSLQVRYWLQFGSRRDEQNRRDGANFCPGRLPAVRMVAHIHWPLRVRLLTCCNQTVQRAQLKRKRSQASQKRNAIGEGI
jgi:hypothetical protein